MFSVNGRRCEEIVCIFQAPRRRRCLYANLEKLCLSLWSLDVLGEAGVVHAFCGRGLGGNNWKGWAVFVWILSFKRADFTLGKYLGAAMVQFIMVKFNLEWDTKVTLPCFFVLFLPWHNYNCIFSEKISIIIIVRTVCLWWHFLSLQIAKGWDTVERGEWK